ncbi:hypothetical protein [Nocardioides sp.]|uniref:hypothetical protein n=1 Tax=Nocardioides sp. TaxID=35761 RepID=UPI002B278719|nr:hypothetical protein [Nocardioides sp.]
MTTRPSRHETVPGLLSVAATRGTGCVHVVDRGEVRSGQVYLVDGALVAVNVDGFQPRVGHRLRSGGLVVADAFATALAACGGDVRAPGLGQELVDRGHLDAPVLAAVHREITLSAVGAMATWVGTQGIFVGDETTDSFTMEPVAIATVLKAVVRRRQRWELLWGEIAGGLAVEECFPTAAKLPDGVAPLAVPAEAEALLAAMTGQRSVDEVAGECGLTRFETGYLLHALVRAGRAGINARPGSATYGLHVHPVPEYTSVTAVDPAPVRPPGGRFSQVPRLPPAPATVDSQDSDLPHPTAGGAPEPVPSDAKPHAVPGTAEAARAARAKTRAALNDHLAAVDDVQAALARIQQHAADLQLDVPRMVKAAGDAAHAFAQIAQEAEVAEVELAAAQEALARAGERVGAVRRAASELEARRDATDEDLRRVRERAAAVTAEQQRLRADAERLAVITTELQGRVTEADALERVTPSDAG